MGKSSCSPSRGTHVGKPDHQRTIWDGVVSEVGFESTAIHVSYFLLSVRKPSCLLDTSQLSHTHTPPQRCLYPTWAPKREIKHGKTIVKPFVRHNSTYTHGIPIVYPWYTRGVIWYSCWYCHLLAVIKKCFSACYRWFYHNNYCSCLLESGNHRKPHYACIVVL